MSTRQEPFKTEISGAMAFVTGANRGIGACIVEALLAAGASKVYAAARNPESVPVKPKVVPIALDVTSFEQALEAARQCGDVQILVNNAGIALGQPLIGTNDHGAAAREMSVNYFGTLSVTRAFAPILARNGGGAVVNVLSILGRVSAPAAGSYSASKAAAFSLTQGIRAELARQGTLVVGLMPGFVDTDMVRQVKAPKLPPADVADALIHALRTGTEDVYPGMAGDVEKGLRHDPKAVERQFAAR